MNRFLIRRALQNDVPDLLALLKDLARFEHLAPPDEAAQKRLVDDGWGAQPRFEAYLAFGEGAERAVGCCVVFETYSTFLARPRLFIEDLWVHPDWRSRGIGRALIGHCLQLAHEKGCHRVECMGLDWNDNAHRIYEKMGAFPLHEWFLYRFERKTIENFLGLQKRGRPGGSEPKSA